MKKIYSIIILVFVLNTIYSLQVTPEIKDSKGNLLSLGMPIDTITTLYGSPDVIEEIKYSDNKPEWDEIWYTYTSGISFSFYRKQKTVTEIRISTPFAFLLINGKDIKVDNTFLNEITSVLGNDYYEQTYKLGVRSYEYTFKRENTPPFISDMVNFYVNAENRCIKIIVIENSRFL